MSATEWMDQHPAMQSVTRLLAERGPQLVVIALLLALSVDCALILTRALSGPAPLPPPSAAAAPRARTRVNPTLELANIVNAHLFGSAALTATGDVPTTTAPLVLTGVIAEQDPSRGQAIIGANAGNAKRYSVGDALPGNVKLHAVYSDRVLIERQGALEALMLPRTAGGALRIVSPAPATQAAPARDNSTLLAGLVRVQPVFNQGKLTGYRIFANGARGNNAFNQTGLRQGDLITAVNGTALDDPSRAMEVLQTLSSAGSATVTVSRNGVGQEVNLNLSSLAEDNATDTGSGNNEGAQPTQAPLLRNRFGNGRTGPATGPEAAPADDGAHEH